MENISTQQTLLQQIRQLAAEVAELKPEGIVSLADNFANWITAQIVAAAKSAKAEAENGCLDLKTLSALCTDAVALRRGDHSAERLKLEYERLELDRGKCRRRQIEVFMQWSKSEESKATLSSGATNAEKIEILGREMYGEDWDT